MFLYGSPQLGDMVFQPKLDAEVIISMYQESAAEVAYLVSSLHDIKGVSNALVHIYTKDSSANTTKIQLETGAHHVTHLPNIGREGETYLQHIVTHWDSLAQHSLFVQAEVHGKEELLWRLGKYFLPRQTGMLDLGFRGHTYSCKGSDLWGWSDTSGVVSHIYNEVYGSTCKSFLATYKGQFLVSASRIRGLDRRVYEELLFDLRDVHSWAHTSPYVDGKNDEMSAPALGYTIERLWGVLFQCSDVTSAWQCPGYRSRLFSGDSARNCQCLDKLD